MLAGLANILQECFSHPVGGRFQSLPGDRGTLRRIHYFLPKDNSFKDLKHSCQVGLVASYRLNANLEADAINAIDVRRIAMNFASMIAGSRNPDS